MENGLRVGVPYENLDRYLYNAFDQSIYIENRFGGKRILFRANFLIWSKMKKHMKQIKSREIETNRISALRVAAHVTLSIKLVRHKIGKP